MEADFMLRWPQHRQVIEKIIAEDLKQLGTHNVAKVGEYVELFSAPPLSTGRDAVHNFAEPNALRIIFRVTKFATDRLINFVHWDSFITRAEQDDARDAEESKYLILTALHKIGGNGGSYTPSEVLAYATSIPLQDVDDYLDVLQDESKVTLSVSSGGTAAYMESRGRLYLREVAMGKKQPRSIPRRIFISHGKSSDWREVQAYVEREVGIDTLELAQEPFLGRTILQKLDDESIKCGYAVIVMTGDDRHGDEVRARENVIHEIGFFQGRYGLNRVCLLYEQGVNIPSNMHGLGYVQFPSGLVKAGFADLRKEIEAAFA